LIRVLEDRVVNKIAAGEVVERPASALKELVENALDAGGRDLRIELRSGGRNLIVVADDGSGMPRADATLCIERHATSKIRTDEDLFQVSTLGFRGEALPSIAAVSRFELVTRRPEDEVGTRLQIEGGKLVGIEDAGTPAGTRISVRSLFFNVPARRKFLRTVPTEFGHCLEAVVRQSLIRPDLDVEVRHDGTVSLRAPRVADRAARAADLLGPHGRALVPASFERGTLSVEALVSPVGVHKGSVRGSTYLYVNGRFVQDPQLRRAVREAYRGIVPKGRYPTLVLEVRIPPEHVDVNVHPAKTEVRFRHGRELVAAIAAGVRSSLEQHGIKRPVERPAPIQVAGANHAESTDQGTLPLRQPSPSGPPSSTPPSPLPSLALEPATVQFGEAALAGGDQAAGAMRHLLPVPRFQDLRVLGQLDRKYILCEGRGELVIVDQHAAHERVTLHRLMQSEHPVLGAGQRLLTPPVVELSPARARALEPHTALLARYGLEVEPFGGHSVVVKQVPQALARADPSALIGDVADDLAAGGDGAPLRDRVEHLLATMACHTSVRAGQTLSPYEMRELLRAVDEVDFSVCAHGRPVSIRISPTELERRFHRA
jgi:DNA mismatch repair protein MutL